MNLFRQKNVKLCECLPQNSRSAVPAEVDLLGRELEVGDLGELCPHEERHREEEGEGGHQEGDDDGLGHVELGQVGMDDAAIPASEVHTFCAGIIIYIAFLEVSIQGENCKKVRHSD